MMNGVCAWIEWGRTTLWMGVANTCMCACTHTHARLCTCIPFSPYGAIYTASSCARAQPPPPLLQAQSVLPLSHTTNNPPPCPQTRLHRQQLWATSLSPASPWMPRCPVAVSLAEQLGGWAGDSSLPPQGVLGMELVQCE